jgi:hypothetical protein
VQPENKRPTGQIGDGGQASFDPGPSFSEDQPGRAASDALPSWLQSFAESAGESADQADPKSDTRDDAGSTWIDPSRTSATAGSFDATFDVHDSRSASQSGQPADNASANANFFSDDDLPEWLRALNTSEPASGRAHASVAESVDAGPSPAGMSAVGVIAVPAVSRAWVTAADPTPPSPGAGTFAALVHELDTRPDTVGGEPVAVPAARPQLAAPTREEPITAVRPAERKRGKWGRFRLWGVSVIVVLTYVLYFVTSR